MVTFDDTGWLIGICIMDLKKTWYRWASTITPKKQILMVLVAEVNLVFIASWEEYIDGAAEVKHVAVEGQFLSRSRRNRTKVPSTWPWLP